MSPPVSYYLICSNNGNPEHGCFYIQWKKETPLHGRIVSSFRHAACNHKHDSPLTNSNSPGQRKIPKGETQKMDSSSAQLNHNLLHHLVLVPPTKYTRHASTRPSRQRSRPKRRIQAQADGSKHNQGYDRIRKEVYPSSSVSNRTHTRNHPRCRRSFSTYTPIHPSASPRHTAPRA